MKTSALESKTVRPGLMRYSFYASERRPVNHASAQPKRRSHKLLMTTLLILIVAGGAAYAFKPAPKVKPPARAAVTSTLKKTPPPTSTPVVATTPAPTNYCAGNTLSNFVKVSISLRHMWACQGSQDVFDTSVVTGIEYLAADRTPVGTYHIYGKYTDQILTGSDTTGSWRDPVSYWMPFLDNQYGQYGFHDATWRADSDFGNIDPNSANASHGCVEMPLAAAKWLYDWAPIGTTITIQS